MPMKNGRNTSDYFRTELAFLPFFMGVRSAGVAGRRATRAAPCLGVSVVSSDTCASSNIDSRNTPCGADGG